MEKTERKGVKISGEYLRELRQKKGLSLQKAASMLGISAGHLSNIERGIKGIGGALMLKMAELYGLPVQDLVGEAEPPVNTVDLIAELYKADYVLYDGRTIDVRDEFVAARIEMGIRMGIAWAMELIEQRRKEGEERRGRRP